MFIFTAEEMSLVVKNAEGCKCTIGCVNNAGRVKFLPEYRKLFDILYELGSFGATNGPDAGTTVTNFWLPTISQSTFLGTTTEPGFLNYTVIPDESTTPNPDLPFYFLDEGPVLFANFPDLISEIKWESDVEVELTFLTPPYGSTYYDLDRVYPMLDVKNKLMIVRGTRGCVRTTQYDNIFIYANRPCNVTITFNAINPLEQFEQVVGDIPVPTTLELCDAETVVAWSVLETNEFILYYAAKGFEKVAAVIKNTVEFYSKPNPIIVLNPDTSRSAAFPTNDIVIIMQNIATQGSATSYNWTNTLKAIDQYGVLSPFIRYDFAIGGLLDLYTLRTHYPIVSCTLCLPVINTPSTIPNISITLTQTSGKYVALKRENTLNMKEPLVTPTLVSTGSGLPNYWLWGTSFNLDSISPSYDRFAIQYTRLTTPDINLTNAEWKVKITFRARDLPKPQPQLWNPFGETVRVLAASDSPFILSSNEQTVGSVLLVGGGGGGGGSASYSSVTPPNAVTAISGGGGARGLVTQASNLNLASIDPFTNTYVNRPIQFTIGKGGAGGSSGNVTGLPGMAGGDTQIVTINDITTADGGLGAISPNGANSGGGGGSSGTNAIVTYGTAGNAGQGSAGQVGSGGVGGKGGNGPIISFPTIVITATPGKPGTTSDIPAGGGAGGITDTNGIQYGNGGTGSDITKVPGEPGQTGNDGYICLVTRYIKY